MFKVIKLEAEQNGTVKIAAWQEPSQRMQHFIRGFIKRQMFSWSKLKLVKEHWDVKRNYEKQHPQVVTVVALYFQFKKSWISCTLITSLKPNTSLRSHAGRVPSVKSVHFQHSATKVLLQHDWASVLLLMPAREFEQWERGLRLSDKPQGKHILFSSYCLSLSCIVL